MNNIHAEVDEILRTGNKKAIVSLFLSMQGNYIRATEAEAKLAKAQAEIERKDKLIEQMREALKALRKYPNTYIATEQGYGIAENDLAMCDAALAAERTEK